MKDNTSSSKKMLQNNISSNNQIYQRLYQEVLKLGLEPNPEFFGICRNIYSPKRRIEIINFIKKRGYLPIQYKMWLTND